MAKHASCDVNEKPDNHGAKKAGPTDGDLRVLRARFHNRLNRFANAIDVQTPFVKKDADGGIRVKVHKTQESSQTSKTQDDDDDEFTKTVFERIRGDLGGFQPLKTRLKTRTLVIERGKKKSKYPKEAESSASKNASSGSIGKGGKLDPSEREERRSCRKAKKAKKAEPRSETQKKEKIADKSEREKKEKVVEKSEREKGTAKVRSAPVALPQKSPVATTPKKSAPSPKTKTAEKPRKTVSSESPSSRSQKKVKAKAPAALTPAPIPITPKGTVELVVPAPVTPVSSSPIITAVEQDVEPTQMDLVTARLHESKSESEMSSSSTGGSLCPLSSSESINAEILPLTAPKNCEREKIFEQLDEDILLDNKVLQEIATDLNKGINNLNRTYIDESLATQLMNVDKQKYDEKADALVMKMADEPIEVDATAQKVVEALTSSNVLGRVLSTDESKLLSDYFNGLHPLDEKVLKVLETVLDKILERADQFYGNKDELVRFMRNREKAKKHLLDAMISKKTGYLQNMWGNAYYYAKMFRDGVAGVVDVANKSAVVARENAKVAMDYANRKASEAKELANRAQEGIHYANQKASESVVAAKEKMNSAYAVANQQVNNAVEVGQIAKSKVETATIVARMVTADATEKITTETTRAKMTAETAITVARLVTEDAVTAVSSGYNKIANAWGVLCSYVRPPTPPQTSTTPETSSSAPEESSKSKDVPSSGISDEPSPEGEPELKEQNSLASSDTQRSELSGDEESNPGPDA